MADWTFDPVAHVYRKGKQTLSHDDLMAIRNAIADGMSEESAALARQLVAKAITLAEWAKAFARLIADGVTAAFLLGRGGTAQLDADATAALGELIATQHDYAADFAKAIAAELDKEEPQLGFVSSRSSQYAGASVNAFDQGRALDFQVSLPYYPADGLTSCMMSCRCEWQIVDTDTELTATWITVGDHKVCDDCEARGKEYGPDSPFVQTKGST